MRQPTNQPQDELGHPTVPEDVREALGRGDSDFREKSKGKMPRMRMRGGGEREREREIILFGLLVGITPPATPSLHTRICSWATLPPVGRILPKLGCVWLKAPKFKSWPSRGVLLRIALSGV